MSDAIVVSAVSKLFRRYADRPVTLSDRILRGWRREPPAVPFWALRGVDLRVARGQAVGVIGKNGAGKSTLLRLVGGIGRPTEGHIATQGRVRALLELGSSFHHDLTGRENIFLAGVVAGLTRREVGERYASIVKFAELESFIDSPLRVFSSGMVMRLAFSVAMHTNPDVLLVDEVLAVGDVGFQYKCLDRIAEFKHDGCAILVVSHDMTAMEALCDEMVWLRDGRVEARGNPKEVIARHVGEAMDETRRRMAEDWPAERAVSTEQGLRINENRFGSLELEIVSVRILDLDGQSTEEIAPGDGVTIEIEYRSSRSLSCPHFGVTICRADGLVCYDLTTAADGHILPDVAGAGRIALVIDRLDLGAGDYFVDVSAHEREWAYMYDSHWRVYPLRVRGGHAGKGLLSPPRRWYFDLEGTDRIAPTSRFRGARGEGR